MIGELADKFLVLRFLLLTSEGKTSSDLREKMAVGRVGCSELRRLFRCRKFASKAIVDVDRHGDHGRVRRLRVINTVVGHGGGGRRRQQR